MNNSRVFCCYRQSFHKNLNKISRKSCNSSIVTFHNFNKKVLNFQVFWTFPHDTAVFKERISLERCFNSSQNNCSKLFILIIFYGFRFTNLELQLAFGLKQSPEIFHKKDILKNSQKSTCARVSFLLKLQASGCFYLEFTFDHHMVLM